MRRYLMGKDINGKELGKGITQRNDGRYNARVTINGVKINLYDYNLLRDTFHFLHITLYFPFQV